MIPIVVVEFGTVYSGLHMCRYERQRRQQQKSERLIQSARIPRVYERDTFEGYKVSPDNREAVQAAHWCVDNDNQGLFLYGERGTGKTKLAAVIANERAKQGKPTLFISVPDLLEEMRYAVAEKRGKETIGAAVDAELLILDDFGAERLTEWAAGQLFLLVNSRYNERRQTIVTSNYSPSELIERLNRTNQNDIQGARIVSRLCEMCAVIRISGGDRRMKERSR